MEELKAKESDHREVVQPPDRPDYSDRGRATLCQRSLLIASAEPIASGSGSIVTSTDL